MTIQIPTLRKYQLRPEYQVPCYEAIANGIRNYDGPFFIDVTVGGGKSLICACIAARARELNKRVLVLARQGEIVEQDSQEMWHAGVKNSIFSASIGAKSTHYPVVVGSEGTVARAMHSELKDEYYDFCIIDEAHQFPYSDEDSQYMKIINELMTRNPKMIIIGMTGSPYRGAESIIGDFWRRCVYNVTTETLVNLGYLVPTLFGYEYQQSQGYDLSEWPVHGQDDNSDYTHKELLAMQRKITGDVTMTQKIMAEVVEITKNRNAVMITGAGNKHLQQIAECLPEDSYVIITDRCSTKDRREGLKAVSRGDKKYILQINCLGTGYSEPLIDTSVILRKIGSLTLLVQLLGRGMRLLKPEHEEAGIIKNDHLVLDFSDTMSEMAEKYHNPILERAQIDKSRKERDLITCPVCSTMNSSQARRCIHRPEDLHRVIQHDVQGRKNYSLDGRCEWFWQSRECPGCKTPNDTTARECRKCERVLIDPNDNLKGKHYTDDDFREVVKMSMRLTKAADGILVDYLIRDKPGENDKTTMHNGEQLVVASEILFPQRKERWARGPWFDFLKKHLHKSWHGRVIGKPAPVIVKQQAMFDCPVAITHRRKPDGKSIIHRKRFLSGDER